MNLIECFLTTQQEKQKVGQGRWKDCLGIWNSSGETWETGIPNIPECQSRALLFRYKDWVWKLSFCCPSTTVHPITELRLTHSKLHPIGLCLWQGLPGPTSLSPLLLLLLGLFVLFGDSKYFTLFIFNTLLSLCASGKMVKKVCPCNQLCSNYLFSLLPLDLIAKPVIHEFFEPRSLTTPGFSSSHLSSSTPFPDILFNMLNCWPLASLPD